MDSMSDLVTAVNFAWLAVVPQFAATIAEQRLATGRRVSTWYAQHAGVTIISARTQASQNLPLFWKKLANTTSFQEWVMAHTIPYTFFLLCFPDGLIENETFLQQKRCPSSPLPHVCWLCGQGRSNPC